MLARMLAHTPSLTAPPSSRAAPLNQSSMLLPHKCLHPAVTGINHSTQTHTQPLAAQACRRPTQRRRLQAAQAQAQDAPSGLSSQPDTVQGGPQTAAHTQHTTSNQSRGADYESQAGLQQIIRDADEPEQGQGEQAGGEGAASTAATQAAGQHTEPKYKTVMLKVSGEALMGPHGFGVDPEILQSVAAEVAAATQAGVRVAIVVGGGNFFRGAQSLAGLERATGDYVGMLATVMNALCLQSALEKMGVETRVQTAIEMREVAEPYIRRRAMSHLAEGRVVIFGAGTGNPFFTTDTAAALRAAEVNAEVFLKATKVDGIYDSDPVKNPQAKRFDQLSYRQVSFNSLNVMDETAITLCKENNIPVIVFNIMEKGNVCRACLGQSVGTVVSSTSSSSQPFPQVPLPFSSSPSVTSPASTPSTPQATQSSPSTPSNPASAPTPSTPHATQSSPSKSSNPASAPTPSTSKAQSSAAPSTTSPSKTAASGKLGEEDLYRRVLAVKQRALGAEHSDTLTSQNDLARCLKNQGKLGEAEVIYRSLLAVEQRVFGADHPYTLSSLYNLAVCSYKQGKLVDAEAMYRSLFAVEKRVLGAKHPHTLISQGNLAGCLMLQGKLDEAEAMYRDTLAIKQRVFGDEHPDTLTSQNNLANCLKNPGKLGEAEAMIRDTLSKRQSVLGDEHPDTLSSLQNLGYFLQEQDKHAEAEVLHKQRLDTLTKKRGPDNPATLDCLDDCAWSVFKQPGREQEARVLYEEALEKCERVLGPDDKKTQRVQGRLNECINALSV